MRPWSFEQCVLRLPGSKTHIYPGTEKQPFDFVSFWNSEINRRNYQSGVRCINLYDNIIIQDKCTVYSCLPKATVASFLMKVVWICIYFFIKYKCVTLFFLSCAISRNQWAEVNRRYWDQDNCYVGFYLSFYAICWQ